MISKGIKLHTFIFNYNLTCLKAFVRFESDVGKYFIIVTGVELIIFFKELFLITIYWIIH